MTYQGYTNFSEFSSTKAETVTTLGFDVIGFIGRHPILASIFLIIIFGMYKFFLEPFVSDQPQSDFDEVEEE